jgi:hypothetical protein
MRSALLVVSMSGSAALFAACSAENKASGVFTSAAGPGGGDSGGNVTSGGTGGKNSGNGSGGELGLGGNLSGAGGNTGPGCSSGVDEDLDKDGFTVTQGDCNDCDLNVNPGAIEVIALADPDGGVPASADEDCDGMADNVPQPCDDTLALADGEPMHAANAIELCAQATAADKKWGVLEAKYVRANGNVFNPGLQVGLQPGFGPNVNPQAGKRLFALSSGHARTPGQPGSCNTLICMSNTNGTAPAGFPAAVPGCPGNTDINDDVALEVKLRSPKNATGYSFDFFFYTFEYPEWVCKSYNDQFIALVTPPPTGSINGNISFDSMTNPVSVNIAFFSVCKEAKCTLGTSALQGTGFDTWNDAGGTSWLKTQAPVTGGDELSIRFAIWDTGDQSYDSTALVDNFQWIANGGTVGVGTDPIETPK